MKRSILLAVTILLLAVPLWVAAQEQDFQVWTRLSLKYNPYRNTRLYLEEEFRFRENAQRLDKYHTELGMGQKLTDRIEVGGFYRFINVRDVAGYNSFNHRFAFQASYEIPLDPWKIWVRPRFQFTFDEFYHSRDWDIPEYYLRTEGGVSRESRNKKTEYYIDIELWFPFEGGHSVFVDQYRLTTGIDYKVDRNRRWGFFYRLQQEVQVVNPKIDNILGISFTYLIR